MSYSNYQSRRVPWVVGYLGDLFRYRHLCWNLVSSDLRSRFRRSRLGIMWAVIQPAGYALIIAWAWAAIFDAQSYWVFATYVFAGMLVWDYFSNTTISSMDALSNSVGYLRQSRIPFFIFQVRSPLSGLVVFLAGITGLIVMIAATGKLQPPGLHLLLVPAYLVVLPIFAVPVAVIFSILGSQLRDLKHIITLALQAAFFLSPVMLQREMFDSPHLTILNYVNPLVPLLNMFRDPLMYGRFWEPVDLIVLSAWTVGLWLLAVTLAARAGRRLVFAL